MVYCSHCAPHSLCSEAKWCGVMKKVRNGFPHAMETLLVVPDQKPHLEILHTVHSPCPGIQIELGAGTDNQRLREGEVISVKDN